MKPKPGLPQNGRLSDGLVRNAGQMLGIHAVLNFVLTHVEKDRTVIFIIVLGIKAQSAVITDPR